MPELHFRGRRALPGRRDNRQVEVLGTLGTSGAVVGAGEEVRGEAARHSPARFPRNLSARSLRNSRR